MREFVVLYQDLTGKTNYAKINSDLSRIDEDIEHYTNIHQGQRVIHVFDTNTDILKTGQKNVTAFISHCRQFGFVETDYGRIFKSTDSKNAGHIMKFIGFIHNAKKYKCLLVDTQTGRNVKATPGYVKKMLIEHEI